MEYDGFTIDLNNLFENGFSIGVANMQIDYLIQCDVSCKTCLNGENKGTNQDCLECNDDYFLDPFSPNTCLEKCPTTLTSISELGFQEIWNVDRGWCNNEERYIRCCVSNVEGESTWASWHINSINSDCKALAIQLDAIGAIFHELELGQSHCWLLYQPW